MSELIQQIVNCTQCCQLFRGKENNF